MAEYLFEGNVMCRVASGWSEDTPPEPLQPYAPVTDATVWLFDAGMDRYDKDGTPVGSPAGYSNEYGLAWCTFAAPDPEDRQLFPVGYSQTEGWGFGEAGIECGTLYGDLWFGFNDLTLSGYVNNLLTNAAVAGAALYLNDQLKTYSDQYGHYEIEYVPVGNHKLRTEATGYATKIELLLLRWSQRTWWHDVKLSPEWLTKKTADCSKIYGGLPFGGRPRY